MVDTTERNIAAIADALSLKEKARADARENKPDPDAPQWMIKGEIVGAVSREGNKELEDIEKGCSAAREAIGALENGMRNFGNYRHNDGGVKDAEIARNRAVNRLERVTADYNQFREDNGLIRDASGDDRVTQVVWAIFIIVAEGIVNSFFLKDISEHGYSGGFLWAFFISFVNVGFAFLGGVAGARYFVNHKDVNKKLFGLLWLLLCLSVCLLTVALSAWFRGHAGELLAERSVEIGKISNVAWKAALTSANEVEIIALFISPESALLFLVGVLCTIFGLYKGYQYDDPYPGYGDINRTREFAQDEYEEARKHCDEQYRASQNEYRNQYDILTKTFTQMQNSMGGLGVAINSNDDINRQLINCAQALLSVYSRENAKIRPERCPEAPADLFDNEFKTIKDRYAEFSSQFSHLQSTANRMAEKYEAIPDNL